MVVNVCSCLLVSSAAMRNEVRITIVFRTVNNFSTNPPEIVLKMLKLLIHRSPNRNVVNI